MISKREIDAAKKIVSLPEAKDTKLIECPEHGTHKAVLYCYPHKFAGIWECDYTNEDISDSHDHYKAFDDGNAELIVEEIIDYRPTPYQIDTNTDHDEISHVYVCGGDEGCGIQLEGNPDLDAFEDSQDY